jgi:hypothetical protein
MKIPHHWAKGTAQGLDRRGKKVVFSCWRWSDTSVEEAAESALNAAKQIVQRLVRRERLDRYAYGERPLREEILDEQKDSQGNQVTVVTRNSYGCKVLNTATAMFIDIDLPKATVRGGLGYLFRRIFGKVPEPPKGDPREEEILARLERFCQTNAGWGLRVYRTSAGLRCLATHGSMDPCSPKTVEVLQFLGSDPLYTRLCTVQKCFRARLTPKPWRCRFHANTVRYPYESERKKSAFERWEREYSARSKDYATSRFLCAIGNPAVDPWIQQIVDFHDKFTRCDSDLPLA